VPGFFLNESLAAPGAIAVHFQGGLDL